MAKIPDNVRVVFAELNKTALDNFTPIELARIADMAEELRPIIADTKSRFKIQMNSGGDA